MSENKPYTLRRLNGDDLWDLIAIAGKVLPDDLMPYFTGVVSGERSLDEIGSEIALRLVSTIIKDISKVKDEVYTFLEGVSGLNKDEINSLGLLAVPKMIWEIYNAEKDFFGQQA